MMDLPDHMDDLAQTAEHDGEAEGWGDVLAVAVIYTEGVRMMTYGRHLSTVDVETLELRLSDLSEMLIGARRGELS